jgi:hypothetical protein
MLRFSEKPVEDTDLFGFSYAEPLADEEQVLGATFSIEVVDGRDPHPEAMLVGPARVTSPIVTQLLQGGLAGVTYQLECVAYTSAGRSLTGRGQFGVV